MCTAADPGSLFLCSLTGQCCTGENAFPSGLKSFHFFQPLLKKTSK